MMAICVEEYLQRSYPDIRYLFGPVSLSATFAPEAVAAIVYFYRLYLQSDNPTMQHKDPYRIDATTKKRLEQIFKGGDYRNDLRRLKEKLEVMGFSIPVLYKMPIFAKRAARRYGGDGFRH